MSNNFNYDRAGVCEDVNTTYENQPEYQREFQDAAFGDLGQCRPTGWFSIYIANDDESVTIDGVDGTDVTMPNVTGLVKGDGSQVDGTEEAQLFRAFINLDWDSEDFGLIDGEGVGIAHDSLFAGTFWQTWFGWGTYQNNDKVDQLKYDSIFNHPNMKVALNLQMMSLKKWADFHGISHEEVENRLRKNSESLADAYKIIVDSNVDVSTIVDDGQITIESAADSGEVGDGTTTDANSQILKDILNEEIEDLESSTGGIGQIDNVLKTFENAPKEFATAFGLEEGKIVTLKYPHDAVYGQPGIAGQDHIVIEQFQYKAPQALFLKEKRESASYLSGLRRNSNIDRFIGIAKLPIPNNLSFSNGVSWGDSKLNAVEAAAFFNAFSATAGVVGTGDIGGFVNSLGQDLGQIIKEIQGEGLKTGSPANLALSSFIAQFALGRVGINVDGNAALTRGTGAAINPNLELLFNGPKLRNFQFAFNFAPNDEMDGRIMRRMQKFFKMGMSPVRNQDNLLFLGSPNVFRIRYRTKERERIKGLPMHKICALTSCEINYAPDNVYQSYEDEAAGSSPVRTIMNLSFTELTPIFQDDYLNKNEKMAPENKTEGGEFNDLFNNSLKVTKEDGDRNLGDGDFEPMTAEDTGF
tara:strand:- start:658 stop:2574 length:1917 start_codon:yes stop_codon:yes gene_type:complete